MASRTNERFLQAQKHFRVSCVLREGGGHPYLFSLWRCYVSLQCTVKFVYVYPHARSYSAQGSSVWTSCLLLAPQAVDSSSHRLRSVPEVGLWSCVLHLLFISQNEAVIFQDLRIPFRKGHITGIAEIWRPHLVTIHTVCQTCLATVFFYQHISHAWGTSGSNVQEWMRVRQQREEELVVGVELETEWCPHLIRLGVGKINLVVDDKRGIQTNIA